MDRPESARRKKLRELLREKRGDLKQSDLARRLGKGQTWVSGIESGRLSINATDLIEWAEALGVSPSEIIEEVAREPAEPRQRKLPFAEKPARRQK